MIEKQAAADLKEQIKQVIAKEVQRIKGVPYYPFQFDDTAERILTLVEAEQDALRLEAQKELVRQVLDAPPGEFPRLEAFKQVIRERSTPDPENVLKMRQVRNRIEQAAATRAYQAGRRSGEWESVLTREEREILAVCDLVAPATTNSEETSSSSALRDQEQPHA